MRGVSKCGKLRSASRSPGISRAPFRFAILFLLTASALKRWETLPQTPAPIVTDLSGEAAANSVKIHYAVYGQGSPVPVHAKTVSEFTDRLAH